MFPKSINAVITPKMIHPVVSKPVTRPYASPAAQITVNPGMIVVSKPNNPSSITPEITIIKAVDANVSIMGLL
jgi:hypothetical protein